MCADTALINGYICRIRKPYNLKTDPSQAFFGNFKCENVCRAAINIFSLAPVMTWFRTTDLTENKRFSPSFHLLTLKIREEKSICEYHTKKFFPLSSFLANREFWKFLRDQNWGVFLPSFLCGTKNKTLRFPHFLIARTKKKRN